MKRIQGFMAAFKDIAKLYDGADPDKPDPKVEAQAAAIAKKNGFAVRDSYTRSLCAESPAQSKQ
jgi:hypothetical protein